MIPSDILENIGYLVDAAPSIHEDQNHYIVAQIVSEWLKSLDEPITTEALEREGWKCPIHHYLPPNSDDDPWSPTVGVIFVFGKTEVRLILSSGRLVKVPGCKTMAQLRTLVEMIGEVGSDV